MVKRLVGKSREVGPTTMKSTDQRFNFSTQDRHHPHVSPAEVIISGGFDPLL